MSRLDVATRVLSTTRDEYIAAESRIRDVDVAEDTAKMVRLGILQDAASAIMAQANQQSSLVLELLGGSGVDR